MLQHCYARKRAQISNCSPSLNLHDFSSSKLPLLASLIMFDPQRAFMSRVHVNVLSACIWCVQRVCAYVASHRVDAYCAGNGEEEPRAINNFTNPRPGKVLEGSRTGFSCSRGKMKRARDVERTRSFADST